MVALGILSEAYGFGVGRSVTGGAKDRASRATMLGELISDSAQLRHGRFEQSVLSQMVPDVAQ